jgi:hypothetical protein
MSSPDGIPESYGINSPLTPEENDKVRAYMNENPAVMI